MVRMPFPECECDEQLVAAALKVRDVDRFRPDGGTTVRVAQ